MLSDAAKRVIVTGAQGFIGQHCVRSLLRNGYEVHALSRSGETPVNLRLKWHQVDILSSETSLMVRQIKPDALLHLAWYTEHGIYWQSPLNTEWLYATERLIRECLDAGASRVVTAGTCAEYNWSAGDFSETVSDSFEPGTAYAKAKLDVSRFIEQLVAENVSAAVGRLFYVYGPGEGANRLIPQIIQKLLANAPMHCRLQKQLRDFCHVEDIADGFTKLIDANDGRGVFNLASGVPVSVEAMASLIGQATDRQHLLSFGAEPELIAHEPNSLVADTSKLRAAIDWNPKIDLNSGLSQTVAWFSERGELCPSEHK